MKELVSKPRVMVVAAAACLSVLWALFVVPGGAPWTGMVWLGAMVFLLISSVALILGSTPPASLVAVIPGVDTGRAGRKP